MWSSLILNCTLLDDMFDTMMAQNGVGLAAIQIAVPLNVLIINIPNEEDVQDKSELIEVKLIPITHKDGTQSLYRRCFKCSWYFEEIEQWYQS